MTDELSHSSVDFTPRSPDGEFGIRKVYTKDMSFETPHTPDIFSVEWVPEADVNLRSSAAELQPGEYEVTLTITITVTVGERVAFLAEVQQAGIFGIVGVTSDELAALLGSYCPSILYPYGRELISDLTVRGGFPPFILAPVNFDALYEQHRLDGRVQAPAAGA